MCFVTRIVVLSAGKILNIMILISYNNSLQEKVRIKNMFMLNGYYPVITGLLVLLFYLKTCFQRIL